MAWWGGQNLMDVAVYIDDARSLQLVLLGGHTGSEVEEGRRWKEEVRSEVPSFQLLPSTFYLLTSNF
jgi:hypothetical protein